MATRSRTQERPRGALQLQLDRLASDRWARRGVRVLVRATVLGLSLVCLGVGAQLAFGWHVRWQWLAAAALGCIAGGAALLLRPRMSAREVARRLDRRFRLNEQLSTALELEPGAAGVGAYLDDQARRSIGQIRRYVAARQRFPWAEVALVFALVLALLGLLVIAGVAPAPPVSPAVPLPPLARPPDPVEELPAEPFQPPPGGQPAPGAGEALVPAPGSQAPIAALADALRDQSVTRPAAEALDRNDLGGAAQSLRELADQAAQLSDEARAELADALREAAQQLEAQRPGLAEQLRDSAAGLESGDDQAAAEALEGLAESIEQLGQPGGEQGQGQGQQPGQDAQGQGGDQGQGAGGAGEGVGGEQRAQPTERLGVDGVPLELESGGAGDTPTTGRPDGPDQGQGQGGFTQGGAAPSGERVDVGDDPLRIPADLRDVVQDYFSP